MRIGFIVFLLSALVLTSTSHAQFNALLAPDNLQLSQTGNHVGTNQVVESIGDYLAHPIQGWKLIAHTNVFSATYSFYQMDSRLADNATTDAQGAVFPEALFTLSPPLSLFDKVNGQFGFDAKFNYQYSSKSDNAPSHLYVNAYGVVLAPTITIKSDYIQKLTLQVQLPVGYQHTDSGLNAPSGRNNSVADQFSTAPTIIASYKPIDNLKLQLVPTYAIKLNDTQNLSSDISSDSGLFTLKGAGEWDFVPSMNDFSPSVQVSAQWNHDLSENASAGPIPPLADWATFGMQINYPLPLSFGNGNNKTLASIAYTYDAFNPSYDRHYVMCRISAYVW